MADLNHLKSFLFISILSYSFPFISIYFYFFLFLSISFNQYLSPPLSKLTMPNILTKISIYDTSQTN